MHHLPHTREVKLQCLRTRTHLGSISDQLCLAALSEIDCQLVKDYDDLQYLTWQPSTKLTSIQISKFKVLVLGESLALQRTGIAQDRFFAEDFPET